MATAWDIVNSPAKAVDGQHGTTDTAVLVRFPSGELVPVGVQVGRSASEYLGVYDAEDGYEVVGVQHRGVALYQVPGHG